MTSKTDIIRDKYGAPVFPRNSNMLCIMHKNQMEKEDPETKSIREIGVVTFTRDMDRESLELDMRQVDNGQDQSGLCIIISAKVQQKQQKKKVVGRRSRKVDLAGESNDNERNDNESDTAMTGNNNGIVSGVSIVDSNNGNEDVPDEKTI